MDSGPTFPPIPPTVLDPNSSRLSADPAPNRRLDPGRQLLTGEKKCEGNAAPVCPDKHWADPTDWSQHIFLVHHGFPAANCNTATATITQVGSDTKLCTTTAVSDDSHSKDQAGIEGLDCKLDFESHDACDEVLANMALNSNSGAEKLENLLDVDDTPSEVSFFDIHSTTPILSATIPTHEQSGNDVHSNFAGYCLDCGAARGVIGRQQYTALCKLMGRKLKMHPTSTRFKFGSTHFTSEGIFKTRLRVSPETFV